MAKLRAIYTPGVAGTYFRIVNTAGQVWSTVASGFVSFVVGDANNYRVFATETATSSGVYEATTPGIGAGVFTILFFDVLSSSDPLGAYDYAFDGTNEVTLNVINDDAADLPLPIPVYTQLGTGEVLWGKITAHQFTAFGPYVFHAYDSQTPQQAINLSGKSITFVCSETNGTHLWQITGCTVSGTYSNLVTVQGGDENMDDAGNFKYVLRNVTDDTVIAQGRLIVEAAVDAE